MDETEKIFQEQLTKLPSSVVTFLASSNWNEDIDSIGSMYNLDEDQLWAYRREASLVLAGLVHPDEFATVLGEETGMQGGVLEAVVIATEQKVFAPVRAALVDFFEKEAAADSGLAPEETEVAKEPVQEEPLAKVPFQPSVTPENLPTAPEPEHLIPPIPPKEPRVIPSFVLPNQPLAAAVAQFVTPATIQPKAPTPTPVPETHPFEEKMKQVFTASAPSMSNLSLNPVPPETPPTTPAQTMAPVPPAAVTPVVPTPPTTPAQTMAPVPPAAVTPVVPTPPTTPAPAATTPVQVPPVRRVDPYREPIEE